MTAGAQASRFDDAIPPQGPLGEQYESSLFNSELWSEDELSFVFRVAPRTNYQLVLYFMESFAPYEND